MFIFNLTYVKPIRKLKKCYRHILVIGRKLQYKKNLFVPEESSTDRGIILCNCETRQEAEQIMDQDPFFKRKNCQYEIIEFVPSKSLEEFESFMKKIK